MATPTSRQTLKEYALRRLGSPVIEINIDDSQMEDAIDDAIQFFQEYHFDGVLQVYLQHQVTSSDITNGYIDMDAVDSNVVSVTKLFNLAVNSVNLFDVNYQLALSDFFGTFTPGTLTNYTLNKQHIEMLQDILDPEKNIRFSKVQNRLYGDFNWSDDLDSGDYVVIEAYSKLDPDTYSEIYNDRLLKKYTTALFKRAWGSNLSKFEGVQLPGGIQFNGQRILDEAREDIQKIEEEVQETYELPPDFSVG
tara:strand:- start:1654 stop:2403 length:750 start_codon:yes stop_codon:yes gene_type:complete